MVNPQAILARNTFINLTAACKVHNTHHAGPVHMSFSNVFLPSFLWLAFVKCFLRLSCALFAEPARWIHLSFHIK